MQTQEQEQASAPTIAASDPDSLVDFAGVSRMFAGKTRMTIWRWMRAEGFPQPQVISRRHYWRLGDVLEWRAARHSGKAA